MLTTFHVPVLPQEEWYYVLNSLHYGEEGPELTRTEQFLSEIMKDNPIRHLDHPRWGNPVFKVAPMPIHNSLISMPTVELKELAKSLFRDLQRFINKKIDSSSMEFHIPLAQKIIGQCLTHSKLQDEIYCQLLRQMSGHTVPTAAPVLQVCTCVVHTLYLSCQPDACSDTQHLLLIAWAAVSTVCYIIWLYVHVHMTHSFTSC